MLLAAAYLHDLGMQINMNDIQNYPELSDILNKSGVTLKKLESEPTRLSFIRQWHHKFSYYMITKVLRTKLGLDDYRYVEEIALVAQGHRAVDIRSGEYKNRGSINVRLLSALLRLADSLDCDKDRVKIERLNVIDATLDDKMFWLSNYCIDKVDFIMNRYIKLLGRAPADLIKEMKFLFVKPIKDGLESLMDIFIEAGLFIGWAPSNIIEDEFTREVFLREKGLIDHIRNRCENIPAFLGFEPHLEEADEEQSPELPLVLNITPFYYTGIEEFRGISLKKWPENINYCEYLIYEEPIIITDEEPPEDEPLWTSDIVSVNNNDIQWPQLVTGKEYIYIVHLFEDETPFPHNSLKGKFWIIDNKVMESVKLFAKEIKERIAVTDEEMIFINGQKLAITGAYESALNLLQPLLNKELHWRVDLLIQISNIYKKINNALENLNWANESDRLDAEGRVRWIDDTYI